MLPAFFATTVRASCWTAKVERSWKTADLKVGFFLFTVYLISFPVMLSWFVCMEDFLIFSLPVVYLGKNCASWSWRALGSDWVESALQVSFLNKQNIFDLFTLLTVAVCIVPFWSGSSLLLSYLKSFCMNTSPFIIRCSFFFPSIGRQPTTWPANHCLQI